MLYSDKRTNMLLAGDLKDTYVNVAPVMYTQASFTVTYPENMRSIKDYLALYNIGNIRESLSLQEPIGVLPIVLLTNGAISREWNYLIQDVLKH